MFKLPLDLLRNLREIRRSIRNHKWEESEGGIVLTDQKLFVGGVFESWVNDGEHAFDKNLIVTEGRNHILDVVYHGATQVSPWYIGLFKGNVTPLASWTAANVTANSTEATEYDETTRQEFAEAAAAAGSTTNSASRAVFTMSGSITVYGAFLVSASAKSATTGVLNAAARFGTERAVVDDDVLNVAYTINATST